MSSTADLDGGPEAGRPFARRSLSRRVGLIAGPLAFALLLWLPGLPLDFHQRAAAGVVCWTSAWWLTETIAIGASSLLPAVLLPILGVVDAKDAAGSYMNDLILLFLGAFLLALTLEAWGLHKRLALWVALAVGGQPRRIVLGFMVSGGVLSMWMNNTATCLMLLPIALAVIAAVGSEQPDGGRAFGLSLLLGTAYACSVGGVVTPVGTAPNQVFLGLAADAFPERPEISFAAWMLAFGPLLLVFLPVCWWLLTRVLIRVPADGAAGARVLAEEQAKLGPVRKAEKRAGGLFALAVVLWVTRADVELFGLELSGWQTWAGLEGVSNTTVALGLALLCFVVPSGDRPGEALLDWKSAKGLPWEILILLGGGFCLALGVRASGLDIWLGGSIAPLVASTSPFVLSLVLALGVSLLTEVTSNTATTQVLLPLLASAAIEADRDPYLLMLPATAAASCAFMLPVATPPNAVVFSSGKLRIAEMARVGFLINIVMVITIAVVFHFWGRRVLGL